MGRMALQVRSHGWSRHRKLFLVPASSGLPPKVAEAAKDLPESFRAGLLQLLDEYKMPADGGAGETADYSPPGVSTTTQAVQVSLLINY